MRERNRVIHGQWWFDEPDSPGFVHPTWSKIDLIEADANELRQLATRLADVAQRMAEADEELFPRPT